MNCIFPIMAAASIIYAFFAGTVDETVNACLSGAASSVEIVLSFAGIMCFWSGLLKVAEKSGAIGALSRLISPVTRLIFPKLDQSSAAMQYITANMSANMLGVGNAATPAGISAMNELDKLNPHPEYPSDEMSLFTVLNTSSIQLVPTTVIAMRAAAGSQKADIIIPSVLAVSAISVICSLCAMKLILIFCKKEKKRNIIPEYGGFI